MKTTSLEVVPYVDSTAASGRDVPVMPYFDGNKWHMWTQREDGLFPIQVVDVEQSVYVADAPAAATDLFLPFVEFLLTRAFSKKTKFFIDALESDIHNMGAALEKLELLHRSGEERKRAAYAVTEVEYLFTLCRSAFDLLQEIISHIWESVELLDKSKRRMALPPSFATVVFNGESPRSASEIAAKFSLPDLLSVAYAESIAIFNPIRKVRDGFVHRGKDLRLVFVYDDGFAVSADEPLFTELVKWHDADLRDHRLGSLRLLLAGVVVGTLQRCNAIVEALGANVKFPPSIVGKGSVYLRSAHGYALHQCEQILTKDAWHPFVPKA